MKQKYSYFSRDVSAFFLSEEVQNSPDHIQEELLVHNLFEHLDFTILLEEGPVAKACCLLKEGNLLPNLPDALKKEAEVILAEEQEHSFQYVNKKRFVCESTGLHPTGDVKKPAFILRLEQIIAQSSPELSEWVSLFFTIISETLITKQLSGISCDVLVHPFVRELLTKHAKDEAKHRAFFSSVFIYIWAELPPSTKEEVRELLLQLLLAYLLPDESYITATLKRYEHVLGKSQDLIQRILRHPNVRERVFNAALPTLKIFNDQKVFEDILSKDTFYKRTQHLSFDISGKLVRS